MKILFVSINKLAVHLGGKAPSELQVNCSAAAESSGSAELMLFISFACVSINGASFYEALRVKMVLSRLDSILLDSILLNAFCIFSFFSFFSLPPPPPFFGNTTQKETSNQAELQAKVNAILLWVQPPTLL